MNRRPITQEYFALATDEHGNMQPMRKDESNAGLVVAGLMDLLLNDVITVEKKKITVVNEMPQECGHLASLYTYLSKKPTDAKKVMSAFYAGPRINQLTTDVGESLLAEGLVTTGTNGVFGPKVTYITEKSYRDELIAIIKSALTDTDAITAQDVTLLYILQGTKNLNRYLSQHENNELKAKLKEMKKNPQNKELANLITHIEDLTNLFMIFILIAP